MTTDSERLYTIRTFLGLHESPDGDTQLELGEASEMDNWQVTPEGHLRVRPGLRTHWELDAPVRGLWCGRLGGDTRLVAAADGCLWELKEGQEPVSLGTLTDDATTFFGFGGKLYILNGHEYLCWTGTGQAQSVEGYVPLVVTAAEPAGGGTALEPVNRLTARRRCRFSGDGSSLVYVLPEQDLQSVDRVEIDGTAQAAAAYTVQAAAGTVTFVTAPAEGVNNVEIRYTAASSLRSQVTAMRYAETYNGATDTRVFLYGDGSNRTVYSGLTEAGEPSAEYFPDLSEIAVDSGNTPITGMMKQFSYLMIFKPDGAFSTQYSAVTLDDGTVTAGFCVQPVNREIGCEAPGQVCSVYNYPRTLYAGNLYDWQTVTGGRDERRARLVSQRVFRTLHQADPARVVAFDDEREQEYYLFFNDGPGTALVHRYGDGDVWYRYSRLPVRAAVRDGERIWFGLADGRVCAFSADSSTDDGLSIPCSWQSGAMDFGRASQRKSGGRIWISLKPAARTRLSVTAQTDRRSDYTVRVAASSLAAFTGADFRHWSFLTNWNPNIRRVRLKVRRFAFYRLLLRCDEPGADTTVLGADLLVRYGAAVK